MVEYSHMDDFDRLVVVPNPKIVLEEMNLLKETPKGFWIGYGHTDVGSIRSQGRWVSKTSTKRYAYLTKEEAMENFIKRTQKRINILEY